MSLQLHTSLIQNCASHALKAVLKIDGRVLADTPSDLCVRLNLLILLPLNLILRLLLLVLRLSYTSLCTSSSIKTRFLRPQQFASCSTP